MGTTTTRTPTTRCSRSSYFVHFTKRTALEEARRTYRVRGAACLWWQACAHDHDDQDRLEDRSRHRDGKPAARKGRAVRPPRRPESGGRRRRRLRRTRRRRRSHQPPLHQHRHPAAQEPDRRVRLHGDGRAVQVQRPGHGDVARRHGSRRRRVHRARRGSRGHARQVQGAGQGEGRAARRARPARAR